MPRRKSLTRRFLHHLLLLSLARAILTVLGRGRAWDEWDERGAQPEPEPAQPRGFRRRFAQTLCFSALFFAGLALSAGAGNGVRSLLEEDAATPAAQGASGASGATGPTGPTGPAGPKAPAASAQPLRVIQAEPQARPTRPVAPRTTRVAVQSTHPTNATMLRTAPATKRTAIWKTHTARPSRTPRTRPHAGAKNTAQKTQAPKAPALDPEVRDYAHATVWLNQAAPDPTPPAARLRLNFARELVAFSRQAHVDWALVLATLRAQGRNGRSPAGSAALRSMAFRLSGLGGRYNAWAAALAYSSDATVADRVVALRHYYRAVGLASLVHGLLSQKADLQDRVLHDSHLFIYSGGRHDVASGHVDVRVLALMLYLAQSYHEVTVSCLISGHHLYARPGVVSAHIYGRAVDIAALNNVSITGHQQPGGMTERAVRSVLLLPGGMLPAQVISLLGLGGPSFPLANHYDHIHVGY
jgi:hypothetical protein